MLHERWSRQRYDSPLINGNLAFDAVLQRVLDSARSLTRARYGMMTLLVGGGGVQDFLSSGYTAVAIERLWLTPEGLGVSQSLTNNSEPMRVPNLTERVLALGFSEFTIPLLVELFRIMAAPMTHRSERVGRLFAGNQEDGAEFGQEEVPPHTRGWSSNANLFRRARPGSPPHVGSRQYLRVRVRLHSRHAQALRLGPEGASKRPDLIRIEP